MLAQFNNYRFYLIVAADTMLFFIALVNSYLFRFDFVLSSYYVNQIFMLTPILLPGKVVIFFLFGLYRRMWRYTNRNDLWRLGQATLVSMFYYLVVVFSVHGFGGIPRTIFLVDAILTIVLSGGLRLTIRMINDRLLIKSWKSKIFHSDNRNEPRKNEKSVCIIGAGNAGEKIARELKENPSINYLLLGFLDDDNSKWGRCLHGVKVFGGVDMLPEIMKMERVDEVLIAIPSASGPQLERIMKICRSCEAHNRTLPDLGGIIDGKLSVRTLRDIRYEDLLRRPSVRLDKSITEKYLQGQRVLVTGAGGSIGSELCRQIIRFKPAELILVDASESNLFAIQMQMHHELNFDRYQCILSRAQNKKLMRDIFNRYRPQVVFHASAYKHVPMLEKNPWEAIYNNVLSSQVIVDLAVKYKVERFVLVSTDKAVRPTNVMGASKRLAEMILLSRQGNGTLFMAVRFGNVIGSSGSVLPLFRRQLETGGPITVTHPEVTRYFMTIFEAAQLILQAGGLGEGGEIFILEMGTPVKITKMAEELVRLSGKEPGIDVDIIFTGLRPGEKLYEELITQEEGIVNTRHDKILVLRSSGWNGHENKENYEQWLNRSIAELIQIGDRHDAKGIKEKLKEIIPDYVPQMDTRCVLEHKSQDLMPLVETKRQEKKTTMPAPLDNLLMASAQKISKI